MDERDVITSLNELDDLIADARRRRDRATGGESQDGGASAVSVPIPYAHRLSPARPETNPNIVDHISSRPPPYSPPT